MATPLEALAGPPKSTTINLADKAQVQDYANKYLAAKIFPTLRQKAAVQNNR